VRVRGGTQFVTIFSQTHEPVTTHDRAHTAGQRLTHPDHLPPHKVAGLTLCRDECRQAANTIGVATSQIVTTLLDDTPVDRLRTAGRLLRLGERYGAERLEAACQRALQFDEPTYITVKRILVEGLDTATLAPPVSPPPAHTFVRTSFELLGHLFRGATWS
jgi:hypothetical protein